MFMRFQKVYPDDQRREAQYRYRIHVLRVCRISIMEVLKIKHRSVRIIFARVLLVSVVLAGGLWIFCPKPSLYGDTSFSTAVFDSNGGLLRLTLADDDRYRLKTSLSDIAPAAVEATLLYEDDWFYRHPGVNPVSLLRAVWVTYVSGERTVGASTLTMQLARLCFSLNSSSPLGKLQQILRALQLERHYSKNEILEAYLNLAPYGGNVEGIGTASRIYFDKNARDLTVLEALTLAVIPQDPNARGPRMTGETAELTAARSRAFRLWQQQHPEDADLASRVAMRMPLRHRSQLPFEAPHFVDRVLQKATVSGRVYTTLDPDMQRMAHDLVERYVAERRTVGIRNAAVLLVDTRDVSVSALVGSADWYNDQIHGQVNGTAARRSPGSALKPFIYTMALDQGLIHPMTLMEDAPVRFGVYTPENFDQGFIGPVFAQDALIYSRNIPAVTLAAQLKQPDFYDLLKTAGIDAMQSREFYGLAIALGGIEVTMEEMVSLYATLANGGVQHSLAFLREQARPRPGRPLFSAEAAFITGDMLARNPRPNTTVGLGSADTLFIPWKTGTSYAFRDAWSVGLVGPYVLAVWVGNFSGEGNPAFVGSRAAAPLFFRLADALRYRGINPNHHRPEPTSLNVRRVDVCAATGDLPNRYCPHMDTAWFIPGVSPIKISDVYRPVRVDPVTGRRVCPDYNGPTTTEVFEFWPSNLLDLFRKAGLPRRTPPPFMAACSLTETASTGMPPRIITPQPTLTYSVRADRLEEERIGFQARADADAKTLFWFLDGHFVGRSKPGTPLFWQAKPGNYRVRVVDDLGRADGVTLRVALLPQI